MKNDYFEYDFWNLKRYPDECVRQMFASTEYDRILDFTEIHSDKVKQQIKDYICDFVDNKLPSLKKNKHTAAQLWARWKGGIEFLSQEDIAYTDIRLDFERLKALYVDYQKNTLGRKLPTNPISGHYVPNNLITGVYQYLVTSKETSKGLWDRLIWDRSDFNLAEDRINPTSGLRTLSIDYLKDPADIECMQSYIRYMVVNTKISFVSIYGNTQSIKSFCMHLMRRGTTILTAKRTDAETYYQEYGANVRTATLDTRIADLFHFYEYLQAYGYIENIPISMLDRSGSKYQYKLKTVDDEVIASVFRILDQIDPELECMFLILYCIGMRVSEVCQIRNDCLICNEKGYFIIYYSQKMKKDVMNQIPESLYKLIHIRIMQNADLGYDEKYVFHRAPNKPRITSTFQEQMNRELSRFDLRFPNGDPFVFRPHDWRHTLATNMYKSDIDISIIQNVLHHRSVEMTMAYVECDDGHMKQMQHKYLNYRGEELPDKDENERIEMMRANIHAQLLPNGMCGLPVSFGKCPHANSCLDGCEYFRTDRRYLPIHKEYLDDLNQYLRACGENGWKTQYDAAARVRQNVINLIRGLENE